MSRRFPSTVAALLLALPLAGCWEPVSWEGSSTDGVWEGQRTGSAPPTIESVDLPTWPPLGKDGTLAVRVADGTGGSGLRRLAVAFENVFVVTTSGSRATVELRGSQLGEGFGTLDLEIENAVGGRARRAVEKLLVDLTPPEVELERAVVSPLAAGLDGDVAVVVRDAFVLGSVELTFRGTKRTYAFPEAYPGTLGKAWDVSRVAFPARDFPEGVGTAIAVVRDAAGNTTTRSFALELDATPPSVAITSPAPGATVTGPFDVVLAGTDPNGASDVTFDVLVGGSPVATVLGPHGRLTVDPATLPRGPLVLEAIAHDPAGNASPVARVAVVLE